MKFPVFSVNADSLDKYYSPVFHDYEIEYYLYVQIPKYVASEYTLFQIDEVSPNRKEIPIAGFIDACLGKSWIRIKARILDLSIGSHVYKFSFVSKYTNDVVSLYFGYILQDSNPDKPYIYMNRDDQC